MSRAHAARATPGDRSRGRRHRPFAWVFTLGSLTVALGILWQASAAGTSGDD